jgi:hypothetical protein
VFSECLIRARDLDYRELLANCVQAAAELTLADNEPEMAARLQSIALHALDRIGAQLQGLEAESFERTAQALATRVGAERLRDIARDTTDIALESILDETLLLLRRDPSPSTSVNGDKYG